MCRAASSRWLTPRNEIDITRQARVVVLHTLLIPLWSVDASDRIIYLPNERENPSPLRDMSPNRLWVDQMEVSSRVQKYAGDEQNNGRVLSGPGFWYWYPSRR